MTGGGKLQHPPTTARKAAWMTTPVAITTAEEMNRDTVVYRAHINRTALSRSAAASSAVHVVDSSDNAGIPDHAKHLGGPPGLPAGRQRVLPQPPVLRSCNKVGPCRRLLPWYVLFHLWANDKMGLDGTGWAAVLPSPCLQLPVRTSTRPVARFLSSARGSSSVSVHSPAPSPLQRETDTQRRYSTSLQMYNALVLPTPAFIYRKCSHVSLLTPT